VDIGCGMAAVKTSLPAKRLPDSLRKVRLALEEAIPLGPDQHESPVWTRLGEGLRRQGEALMERFPELSPDVQDLAGRATRQLGTLGGGNHFIELCLDADEVVWLMLHSGSRNIGKSLAEIHMAKAKRLAHNQALQDRELAAFLSGTPEMEAYRHDLFWAQEYAALNRAVMLALYQRVLAEFWPSISFGEAVFCHHNYVAEETHFGEELLVTRKGAIRAGLGEMGIIPGSMGTKSYIVRGLGNPESFLSASHGAGRKMSRNRAKTKFTLADLREQTEGVECRKDAGVLDEIPGAYKNIDKVMEQQKDLVEILAELKQIMCVKG
jgi:tRNA-splicing ligase RtcB